MFMGVMTTAAAAWVALVGLVLVVAHAQGAGTFSTFTPTPTIDTFGDTNKFRGAAAVGSKVAFAPYAYKKIGLFDVATDNYQEYQIGNIAANLDYLGAVAVGDEVVFIPFDRPHHGITVMNLANNQPVITQYHESTTGHALFCHYRFSGGAAAVNKVVFAPYGLNIATDDSCDHSKIVVFDMENKQLTEISMGTTPAADLEAKFNGAAAVGNKVVLAPYTANVVGIVDFSTTTSGGFTTVDIQSFSTTSSKFSGAVAVGFDVVFVPRDLLDGIYVYNVDTNEFSKKYSGSVGIFEGGAAVGNKVVFAPSSGNFVGVFDVTTNAYATVSTGDLTTDSKFYGAAAVDTKVVFAPTDADVIGVFDTAPPPPPKSSDNDDDHTAAIVGGVVGGVVFIVVVVVAYGSNKGWFKSQSNIYKKLGAPASAPAPARGLVF